MLNPQQSSSPVWIKDKDLHYVDRQGQHRVWTGQEIGVTDSSPGLLQIEDNGLIYVDANGHERLISFMDGTSPQNMFMNLQVALNAPAPHADYPHQDHTDTKHDDQHSDGARGNFRLHDQSLIAVMEALQMSQDIAPQPVHSDKHIDQPHTDHTDRPHIDRSKSL